MAIAGGRAGGSGTRPSLSSVPAGAGHDVYLQDVRGLSPFVAGVVFLAPSLLASLSGPISGRIAKYARPTAVMAGAGVVSGVGVLAMAIAHGWPAFIVCFAFAGLGFGLGWTFASVGTQDVVSPIAPARPRGSS